MPCTINPCKRLLKPHVCISPSDTSPPSANGGISPFSPANRPISVDISQFKPQNATFLKLFSQNTCTETIFALPLHSLSNDNEMLTQTSLSKEAKKKEFFEKIT